MNDINLEELKNRLRDSAENWLNEVDTRKEAVSAIEQLQLTIARQAKAAKMGMDAAKSSAHAILTEAKKAQAESSPDALASERAANAALTEQVEQIQRELEEARKLLNDAYILQDWSPDVAEERVEILTRMDTYFGKE